jgi:hypothetical protein
MGEKTMKPYPICLYKDKCPYQKERKLRHSGKTIRVCTFDSTCSQRIEINAQELAVIKHDINRLRVIKFGEKQV